MHVVSRRFARTSRQEEGSSSSSGDCGSSGGVIQAHADVRRQHMKNNWDARGRAGEESLKAKGEEERREEMRDPLSPFDRISSLSTESAHS